MEYLVILIVVGTLLLVIILAVLKLVKFKISLKVPFAHFIF